MLMSRPTVNIEGLVGGYTGQGGKTILPHRAVAKIDLRLVPDMTAAEALAALKAHLVKQGFEDIEVNMTGGYDPNSTSADAPIIKKQLALYKRAGIDPIVLPRSAGSWPGYVFTGAMGEDSLATLSGVSADQALDIYGGSRHQHFHQFLEIDVIDPMFYTHLFLGVFFVQTLRGNSDHFFFSSR